MGSGRKGNQTRKPRRLTKKRVPSTKPSTQLWEDRRAGARNIAGVRFQLRLTLMVLVRLAHGQFPASALRPEGMEDIDTLPVPGEQHRFLQAKEVANDTRFLGLGALADFVEHATPLLRRDGDAVAALVTNGRFGGGLEATGWDQTFTPSAGVVQAIAEAMEGVAADEVERLLRRMQLVEEPADVSLLVHELADRRRIEPAVAQLALDRCLAVVVDAAADQASTSLDAPVTLTVSDLDEAVTAAKRAIATGGLSVDDLHRVASPLTFRTRSVLTEEQFLDGVDVRPEHIAADLDVPRTDHLDEIAQGLERDRLVVVVGPSGAGKSALLWRTASEHAERMRVWRVDELSEADADILVAAVEQQQPSARFPMLVCVDDIGRATRSGWRKAATALLDIPGVYVAGAAREEDFAAEDALRRALIVRPNLDRRTAKQIDHVLRERGVIPVMAVDEALPRARGLLMEFLHLVIAGRRLASVLGEQAAALEEPARQKELAVARYVTSAHRVGLDAEASALKMRFHDADLPAALRRLEREHLLVESASGRWTGLHELRSTELSDRLHDRPPPRLADTLALVLADASATDAAGRLPTIVRAATVNEPIAAALATRTRSAGAQEAAGWLEGARLADISEHARACADAARKLPLPAATNLAQFLFMAHSWRFAGVALSILPEQFHEHAAQLPEPNGEFHRRAAASVDLHEWVGRALLAEPAARARLLEALEQDVAWSEDAATRLAAAVPSGDTNIDARVVASIHRCCVDDAARAALLEALPSPNARLQALRDVSPLLTEAEFDPPSGIADMRFMHPIDGNESPERQAADLAAIVLDLLPETKIAKVTVTRYDGADLPLHGKLGPHKAIPRENLPSQVVTRWNRAFTDSTEREFASASLTLRLRQQATAVALARDIVLGAFERLRRFDADDWHLQRRWATRAEQLQRDVGALKKMPPAAPIALAPLGSPPRISDDTAAQALETIASAMSQFADASMAPDRNVRRQQMRLVGSRLRDAAGHYRVARDVGSARLSGETDPLDPVLAEVLDDVASCLIGYADGAIFTSAGKRVTLDDLRAAANRVRHDQQRAERAVIAETLNSFPGVDVSAAQLVDASEKPMPVAEPRRWLVQVPSDQLAAAADALLAVVRAATISHPLAFRVIVGPAEGGALYSYPGLVIGSSDSFPVDVAEMRALSNEAGIPMHSGRYVADVAECVEALVRSSRAARAAKALAGTTQAQPLSERARRELHRTRDIIATVELDEIASHVGAVADLVAEELTGTDAGALAIELDDALAQRVIGPRLNALEAATQAAALAT